MEEAMMGKERERSMQKKSPQYSGAATRPSLKAGREPNARVRRSYYYYVLSPMGQQHSQGDCARPDIVGCQAVTTLRNPASTNLAHASHLPKC